MMLGQRGSTACGHARVACAVVAVIAGAVVGVGVGGCVVNEPEAPTRGVVVSGPPPSPVNEQPPPAPGPQASWVAGYWHWTGMQYAWIPGHWETPPPGTAWAAPRYTSANGHTVYETGGWRAAGPSPNRNALR
jgi:hypothetical protein